MDGEYIHQIVNEIASDAYQGRETGSPGCEMMEEYLAREFQKIGLVPAGDKGSFYYHYTIPIQESSVKASLAIDDRTFYQGYNEDFSVLYKSEWGDAEGKIVFAGYGIFNPGNNRNDFDGLDIKNKIVLMKRGAPKNDLAMWMPSCIDSVKAEYCYKNGAQGVLFFEPLIRTNQRVLRESLGNHLAMVDVLPHFPVFSVDERVVRYVFTNAGQSYYRIINLIENQSSSFETESKCKMTAKGKKPESINARNVLGMIRGTDKQLQDEFIFIGGHMDHVGMDESGKIWNGADDNASGTAVVLGIAQAMVKNNFKPRRSIVFVGWTGEEMGLLGSKAWCEKPTVDMKKIVVYFNLDMVGLGNGKLNMPGIGFAPEVADFLKNNLDTSMLNRIVWSEGGPGGSDHNNFLSQGVPAFAGMTAGTHPNYHQPGDDPEKISTEILQTTGDIIYLCTEKLANTNEMLVSEKRQEENKLKLFSFSFFHPITSAQYREQIGTRSFKLGFVNFSDFEPSKDPDENFISLLAAYDKSLEENHNGNKYVMTTSAFDAMMTRSGLLAAFNPDNIQMDELKFKVLASQGYRLALVDSNSLICRDTAALKKLITMSHHYGVGLILESLNSSVLHSLLSELTDPCLIVCDHPLELDNFLVSRITENGHLILYQPTVDQGIEKDVKQFRALVGRIGINNVLVSPEYISEEGLKYLQRFINKYNEGARNKDAQYKIMGDNFYNMAVRSLQPD